METTDNGCSEAGNWFSGYGMGDCPIRREPCPAGCLRRTIASMKIGIDSHPSDREVSRLIGRNEGIQEAAKLAEGVGSKAVATAIGRLHDPSPGRTAARNLNRRS